MQIKRDFAGSTDMWPTSAGGQLIEVANLTGFTVIRLDGEDTVHLHYIIIIQFVIHRKPSIYPPYTVRSGSRCALRLRYVNLVVSIDGAVVVCCCFTVVSC
jgi:hypothetical protein